MVRLPCHPEWSYTEGGISQPCPIGGVEILHYVGLRSE